MQKPKPIIRRECVRCGTPQSVTAYRLRDDTCRSCRRTEATDAGGVVVGLGGRRRLRIARLQNDVVLSTGYRVLGSGRATIPTAVVHLPLARLPALQRALAQLAP